MAGELKAALDKNTKKKMPRASLERHIAGLFRQVRMASLSTTDGKKPRATPLEYFVDGMTIFISPDAGVKMRNIKVNQNVSLSVSNAIRINWEKQWDKVWAMQITGTAEVLLHGSPEWDRGRDVIDVASYRRALGMSDDKISPKRKVLKIPISKIELWDNALLHQGYTYRQVWQPSGRKTEA